MTNNKYNLKKFLILLGLVLFLILLYYMFVNWSVTPDLVGDSGTNNIVCDPGNIVCDPDNIVEEPQRIVCQPGHIDWTTFTPPLEERDIIILDFLSQDPEICQLLEKILNTK